MGAHAGGTAKAKANWDASIANTKCVDAAKSGSIAKSDPSYKECVGEVDSRFSQAVNASALTYTATLKWQQAQASELKNVFYASADQTRATRKDFGDMPIIVLTKAPRSRGKDETQELLDRRTLIWEDMHTQVAAMSTHGVNEIVPRSSHEIQGDRPGIVVEAIQQTLSIADDQAKKSVVKPIVKPNG